MAKKITFEDNLRELEEIVEKLEKSDADLDEVLKLYEKGIKLSFACDKALETAKQKILILSKGENGTEEVETDYEEL